MYSRVFLPFCFVSFCLAYKPIIYMHGILSGPEESETLQGFIKKVHPGTNITSIDAFNNLHSVEPMWTQVFRIKNIFQTFMAEHPEGIHVICYSQGGLICRGLLSLMPHNVDTFISISSPQAGQYGDTDYMKYFFPNYLRGTIYKYFYTDAGQKWSVANYWHDPHQEKLYQSFSNYLAMLDNDTHSPQMTEYRNNFLRLNKLVMIGGPNDGVITPWQSSHFGFYSDKDEILPMVKQKYYIEDSFGLKTLDERGALRTYVISGVQHTHWIRNETVFECCIKPWLT